MKASIVRDCSGALLPLAGPEGPGDSRVERRVVRQLLWETLLPRATLHLLAETDLGAGQPCHDAPEVVRVSAREGATTVMRDR